MGELADRSGKTVRAIHLYEELALLRPAARSKGRYRLYGEEALLRIRWIGKLQDMGFHLTEVKDIVLDWEASHSAPKAMVTVRELYRQKLDETRAQLERLRGLEAELKASMEYLDTCEVCVPERMISACRSCDLHECTHDSPPELVSGLQANPPRTVRISNAEQPSKTKL
ncbi:MAG: MerR family transcriptional regulator [Polyangiaceae bacterium]|nr:MerR family transcriptional regulator [Polyangiaceae bacterium]